MKYGKWWFPNFIVKFGKLEHLEQLKNGKVYMKDFNYYRCLEKQGQGDKMEGSIYSNQFVLIDGIRVPATVFHEPNPNIKIPIFCAMWINENNAELVRVENNLGELRIHINIDKIKKDFECDYGIIINYAEFDSKISDYCKRNNIKYDSGLINYYDIFHDFSNPWLKNKINSNDRFFTKDIKYQYQNEIRWLIGKQIDKDNIIVEIPPLECCLISPLEKFKDLEIKTYVLN